MGNVDDSYRNSTSRDKAAKARVHKRKTFNQQAPRKMSDRVKAMIAAGGIDE